MLYCFIKDSLINVPQTLPVNWQNISNFHILPPEDLLKYSWYPCVIAPVPSYDPTKQRVHQNLTLQDNQVIQTWIVTDLTQEEQLDYLRAIRPMFARYLEEHMTQQVSYRDYDSIDSAISRYQGCKKPEWAAESKEAQDFLCDCYDAAYQLENAVLAGTTPVPTREEFIAALPVLGWAL